MLSVHLENKVTETVLLTVKKKMLEIMELSEWPLQESFLNYVAANVNIRKAEQSPEVPANNNGPCFCVSMSPQYLVNKIQRLPKSVSIEAFIDDVLFSEHGLLVSENTKRLVTDSWTEHWQHMDDVMEDGVTAVVDIQSASLSRAIRPQMTVFNSQIVMQTIAEVPLLEEVCHATKWNELYRHHWGDISQFVQDNVLLATKYNVRIIETQLGRLRINAIVNEATVTDTCIALQTTDSHIFTNVCRHVVGLFVSLVVKMSLQSSIHSLIIQSTTAALSTSKNRFSTFVEIALSIASSEFTSDVFINFLCPIAHILFELNSPSELQKSLSSCSDSTIALLRQNNLDHPALKLITKSKVIQSRESVPMEIEDSKSKEHIILENSLIVEDLRISEEFEISEELETTEGDTTQLSPVSQETNRQIVEDIRRTEFGVGLKDSVFVTNFNRRMARLVDHFSSDLYANPTHFVIELIQNADDNRYADNVRAHLNMSWQENNGQLTLKVLNNECGFSASDLRSLCDIGASTKSSNRPDKIGRKGIGFKSVFLVSDSPEVHSNGFHIRFNRYTIDKDQQKVSNNALVPEWIDENLGIFSNDSTTIILPIVSSLSDSIRASVAKQLDPSLLLFLRRLRRISIIDGPSIETVDEECINHRKVIVTDQGTKHTWFMDTRLLVIIDSNLQAISPSGLSSTAITISIPFNDNQESHDMPAFAFLPIRSYGLRFIINADFTIPASREDITNNCPWNNWLIDQSADLFVHSINLFLSTGQCISANDIAKFVDSVPLPGEVPKDSPFHILVPKLRTSLSLLSWLPNQDDRLYPPTQLIIGSNDDPVLTKMLCNRLQMSFLHSSINDVANDRRMSVLKRLGCQQLSLSHLASLLAAINDSELSEPALIKSIIVAIHTCLQRETDASSINRILSLMRSIQLWPIISTDKVTISLDNCPVPVFLPSSQCSETSDRYSLLRRVISPSFIASFVSDNSKHVNPAVTILKRLRVYDLTNKSMIEHAIVPCLSDTNKPRQWLIQASQFFVEHCNPQQYTDIVIPRLLFATVTHTPNGIFQTITPSSDMPNVHLPLSLYSNNVVSLFRDRISYTIVDDAYLRCSITANQWTDYFQSVGVSKTFCASITDDNRTTYPELSQLLALNDSLINIELLRYLDLNWNVLSSVNNSNLISSLSSTAWIPVSTSQNDIYQSDSQVTLSKTLYIPSEVVYISSNEPNKQMISDSLLVHFPFCPVMFHNETLPRQLGMTTKVTTEHILAFLKCVMVDQSISVNKQQSVDLYNWINSNLSKESILSIFSDLKTLNNNELFVLLPSENDKIELVPSGRCYWSLPFTQSQQVSDDLSQVFSEHYRSTTQRPLVKMFQDLKELFVDILEVQEFPFVETIAPILHSTLHLLTHDRLQEPNSAEIDLIADVYNVVHYLDNYHSQDCRNQINRMFLIPCLSGRYRTYDDTNELQIYSWRNMANVVSFQNAVANEAIRSIDFLSINCFIKREILHQTDSRNQRRLSASQFLNHYFNLPILEDNINRQVKNRDGFEHCSDTESMFHHLEVIVSQWLQRNMARDTVSNSLHLLASISSFYRGDDDVEVTNSLRHQSEIKFDTTQKIYIGPISGSDSFEMFIGGLDMENDGIEVFDHLMSTLAQWLLDGDSLTYLRGHFRTFYKSLLDLIESSNRDQVSIFIRSHNLRIQPFSIDYIYNMFARNHESSLISFIEDNNEELLSVESSADSCVSENNRKRCKISIESGVPAKKSRMDIDPDNDIIAKSPGMQKQTENLSRPGTPVENNQRMSRPGTPLNTSQRLSRPGTPGNTPRLDQISLRNMDSAYLSGRIGEQLANDKLKLSRRLGEWDIIKMEWLNEHKESMLPYDFKLRAKRQSTGLVETIYLEVKATTQPDKRQFNLSAQEVTAAWSNKSQFHLLLVFHSGTFSDKSVVQYAHIPDVLGQLQDNNCKLLIDLANILND